MALVKRLHRFDGRVTAAAAYALGIVEIEHRILVGAEFHAVVFAGQEAGVPVARGQGLPTAGLGFEHHVGRQVVIHRTEAVGHP